jgi:uncharacterized protein
LGILNILWDNYAYVLEKVNDSRACHQSRVFGYIVGLFYMNKQLLEILACPACKGALIYDKPHQVLICNIDKLAYPIRQGIPVMIIEEARRLTEDEKS